MHTSTNGTTSEAATVADIIRSAAAWWRLAAAELERGNNSQAHLYATLGEAGTAGMVDRVVTLDMGGGVRSLPHDRSCRTCGRQ